jgi:hypothetical protein
MNFLQGQTRENPLHEKLSFLVCLLSKTTGEWEAKINNTRKKKTRDQQALHKEHFWSRNDIIPVNAKQSL